jgi:hypothetical protein
VRNLLALCGDHPRLIALLSEEVLQSIDNPALSGLLRNARDLSLGGETSEQDSYGPAGTLVSVEQLIELAPPEVRSMMSTSALLGKFIQTENPEAELQRICRDLRAQAIQREVIDLQKQLLKSEDPIRTKILEQIEKLTLIRSFLLSGNPVPTDSELDAQIASTRTKLSAILTKMKVKAEG